MTIPQMRTMALPRASRAARLSSPTLALSLFGLLSAAVACSGSIDDNGDAPPGSSTPARGLTTPTPREDTSQDSTGTLNPDGTQAGDDSDSDEGSKAIGDLDNQLGSSSSRRRSGGRIRAEEIDIDAGDIDVDAGIDAGEVDAGEVDAGEVDTGEVDAGVVDAGA